MSGCFDYLWDQDVRFQSRMDKELKKYLTSVWSYNLILEQEGSMSKEQYDSVILSNLKLFVKEMENKLLEKKNQSDAAELARLMA